MTTAKTIVRISDAKMLRHLRMVLSVAAIFLESVAYAPTMIAQMPYRSVLTDEDISGTIAAYRTGNTDERVADFQKEMPRPVTDMAFRQKIVDMICWSRY